MFLTFLTFLPLAGAIGLAFIPKEKVEAIKQTALAIALADFLLSLQLWVDFDLTTADMQFEFSVPWIDTWGISYHVGIDGISLLLYIMTTFLTAISILASWNIKKYIKEYMFAMLALSTGMLGVFISLDMFLFYVFWEFQLVPMYLITLSEARWGSPCFTGGTFCITGWNRYLCSTLKRLWSIPPHTCKRTVIRRLLLWNSSRRKSILIGCLK